MARVPFRYLSLSAASAIMLVIWLGRLVTDILADKSLDLRPTSEREQNRSIRAAFELPRDYGFMAEDSEFCRTRFSHDYLQTLAKSALEYCTPDSASRLFCFHISTVAERQDNFCLGQGVEYDSTSKKFSMACEPRADLPDGAPPFGMLGSYWYDTGPQTIFDLFVEVRPGVVAQHRPRHSFTILVKREGSGNLWHSLTEIFSLTLTLDVLAMWTDDQNGMGLFTNAEEKTRVVVLDSAEDGPYIDLWTLLAKKPLERIDSISSDTELGDIIIPLAGESNPFWQGDWEPNACTI